MKNRNGIISINIQAYSTIVCNITQKYQISYSYRTINGCGADIHISSRTALFELTLVVTGLTAAGWRAATFRSG